MTFIEGGKQERIKQVYGLSSKKIVGDADQGLVSEYAQKNYNEAVAESISAHYAKVNNKTASQIKSNCDKMIAERRKQK